MNFTAALLEKDLKSEATSQKTFKPKWFKATQPTALTDAFADLPIAHVGLRYLFSPLHIVHFISAQERAQRLDRLGARLKHQAHICVFCVKLCRYQHLEVGAKSPSDAWFPCTAQSDTNNDLEYSFWLKVRSLSVCVRACVCVLSADAYHIMAPTEFLILIVIMATVVSRAAVVALNHLP